ncbi:MAG: CMP-N-acetylneuraminic acid synthetase [Acidiferrobacteraceae bacterium]|nr:CMP-N-acetylneuraminic acid synthetase [Acidiferrobacteraceae bacterium]|tara:strand:- start:5843 stop:6547 length:705 start_codon:yes stop_codon:yes gene_type:complete
MYKNRRILAIVPARGGSKGIKLKNLISVGGVSLISRVGLVIQQLPFLDRAIISTDHSGIAETARSAGIEAPFTRPESLSGDTISDVEVLSHALLEAEKSEKYQFDVIVMLQPTSPFRTPEIVIEACDKLIEGNYDSVVTVSRTDSKGHPLKQFVVKENTLRYYDERGKGIIARQQLDPVYHRNGLAYVMTRDCLLVQKTVIGSHTFPIVAEEYVPNIDSYDDIYYAEYLLSRQT